MECKKCDLIDGVLHFKNPTFSGRWCVVVPKAVQPTLLEEAHAGCFAGHLSEQKIYDHLRRSYYWQGMRSDVRRYSRSCLTCASRRGTERKIHPPLQPIPVGDLFIASVLTP